MIILSSSLPKSASTIFATYLEELVAIPGWRNGQNALKDRVGARYVDRIHLVLGLRLALISNIYGTVVLKSHCAPNRTVRWLINAKQLKALYIYRDPRDVVLSAMDHRKHRGGGESGFSKFTDLETGCDGVLGWAKVWREWKNWGRVEFFLYEDLITDPQSVLRRVSTCLGLGVNDTQISKIIMKHEKK